MGTEQTCEKKLQETGIMEEEAAALRSYRIFRVFYSVIFPNKLDIIRKKYVICLQIFSAAILPNIIKIDPTFD